jgi:hypothetical protein
MVVAVNAEKVAHGFADMSFNLMERLLPVRCRYRPHAPSGKKERGANRRYRRRAWWDTAALRFIIALSAYTWLVRRR